MMPQVFLRWGLYIFGLTFVTFLIWRWNRGAQHRRFARAFSKQKNPAWCDADIDFLQAFEKAYGLFEGSACRLSPETTPMAVYLTLYPEHCIYDNCENDRFTAVLRARLGSDTPQDALAQSLKMLSERWKSIPQGIRK